jgi:hypothetical protein
MDKSAPLWLFCPSATGEFVVDNGRSYPAAVSTRAFVHAIDLDIPLEKFFAMAWDDLEELC